MIALRHVACLRAATWVLLIASLALTTSAYGQSTNGPSTTDIATLVERANAAHRDGQYARAAALFDRAFALDAAAALKFNAAQAWRLAGDGPRAADAYALSLVLHETGRGALDDISKVAAQDKLAELETTLGVIRVDEPEGATLAVAHVRQPVPARVHVLPGSHTVTLDHGGQRRTKTLDVIAGESVVVTFVTSDPAPNPRPVAPPPLPEAPPTAGLAPHHVAGLAVLGTGLALGIVTAVLGFETLGADDAWEASEFLDLNARDRAIDFKTATNVVLTAALVCGATSAVLLIIPATDDAPSVSLRVSPVSVALDGRF